MMSGGEPHDAFRALCSPQRRHRGGPDHVPAGTPLPPGRAEFVISPPRRHAAASAGVGSARNASPLARTACKVAADLRAAATTAFLCPVLAFSSRPQRLRALSGRERVSAVSAASQRQVRSKEPPHLEMRPDTSVPPGWQRLGVSPTQAPAARALWNSVESSTVPA